MNAGDCIIARGTAMKDPFPPNAMPKPAPGDGGVAVGSGNVVRPCARMHCASLSIASLRVSDAGPLPGPPPGISFEHAFWADWNAGDWGFIPEPGVILMAPPEPAGSGKFGTPCERMQSANLIPALPPLERDALLGLPDEPQAATADKQAAATNKSAMGRP